jgi:PPM family protein phosphatase
MRFDVAMLSRQGGRRYNEDRGGHAILDGGACFVLADGAGGHGGGDTAARIAVDRVLNDFSLTVTVDREALADFVSAANAAVVEGQSASPELSDMRTTISWTTLWSRLR